MDHYEDIIFGISEPQKPPLHHNKYKRYNQQQQQSPSPTQPSRATVRDGVEKAEKEEERGMGKWRELEYAIVDEEDDIMGSEEEYDDDDDDSLLMGRRGGEGLEGGLLLAEKRETLADDAMANLKRPKDDAEIAQVAETVKRQDHKKKRWRKKEEEETVEKDSEYLVDVLIPGIGQVISTTVKMNAASTTSQENAGKREISVASKRPTGATAQTKETLSNSTEGMDVPMTKTKKSEQPKSPLFDIYKRPPKSLRRRVSQWINGAVKFVLKVLIVLHIIDRMWLSWWIEGTTPEIEKVKLEEYSPEKARQWKQKPAEKQASGSSNGSGMFLPPDVLLWNRPYTATTLTGMRPLEGQSIEQLRKLLQRVIDDENFSLASQIAQRLAIKTCQQDKHDDESQYDKSCMKYKI